MIKKTLCSILAGLSLISCGDDSTRQIKSPDAGIQFICKDKDTKIEKCGLNNRGTLEYVCQNNQWLKGQCNDLDKCVDNSVQTVECGDVCVGTRQDKCVNGQWEEGSCEELTKLTQNPGNYYGVRISNTKIIYSKFLTSGSDGHSATFVMDINGENIIPISENGDVGSGGDIAGDFVAFNSNQLDNNSYNYPNGACTSWGGDLETSNHNCEVFLYNLVTKETVNVSNDLHNDRLIKVYNNGNVLFQGMRLNSTNQIHSEIYVFDFNTKSTKNLTGMTLWPIGIDSYGIGDSQLIGGRYLAYFLRNYNLNEHFLQIKDTLTGSNIRSIPLLDSFGNLADVGGMDSDNDTLVFGTEGPSAIGSNQGCYYSCSDYNNGSINKLDIPLGILNPLVISNNSLIDSPKISGDYIVYFERKVNANDVTIRHKDLKILNLNTSVIKTIPSNNSTVQQKAIGGDNVVFVKDFDLYKCQINEIAFR